jgi:hypothetical protein
MKINSMKTEHKRWLTNDIMVIVIIQLATISYGLLFYLFN